jgi:hypothetical protein
MDTLLQPPVATAFDAASSFISALLYLIVALAALAYAPRDSRVRVFLAIALASAAPFGITTLIYLRGSGAVLNLPVMAVTVFSLMIGSVALLHFTQVFPWRRPWIRTYGRWAPAAYAVVVLVAAVVYWIARDIDVSGDVGNGSGGLGASVGLEASLLLLGLVIPAIFLLGVVVPFAGLLSLYKSWLRAKAENVRSARLTTFWMLVSQLAGGVLTILIIPLLRLVAPRGPWVTLAAAVLFGVGLLMPLAFAAGIWKLGVLDLDATEKGHG